MKSTKPESVASFRDGVSSHQSIPELVSLDSVVAKPIDWLWRGRVALGKVSMIAGDPGLGKSLMTIAMAAVVTRGGEWPVDGTLAPLGSVILMSAEDDLADTIRPRLDAAGADVKKVRGLTMVREVADDGRRLKRFFSLSKDLDVLRLALTEMPDCRLIVIDPISAFTGQTDTHNNSEVRGLLAPLAELAQSHAVAIVGVTHLNKGTGSALYRAMGSLAFVAAARSVIAVTKDLNNASRRLVLPVKNNLGNDETGLAYTIQTGENGAPIIVWESEAVALQIDQALEQDYAKGEREEAREWLCDVLAIGSMDTVELQRLAKKAGHSWSTVRRAKKDMSIGARKMGYGGKWVWELPEDAQQ